MSKVIFDAVSFWPSYLCSFTGINSSVSRNLQPKQIKPKSSTDYMDGKSWPDTGHFIKEGKGIGRVPSQQLGPLSGSPMTRWF